MPLGEVQAAQASHLPLAVAVAVVVAVVVGEGEDGEGEDDAADRLNVLAVLGGGVERAAVGERGTAQQSLTQRETAPLRTKSSCSSCSSCSSGVPSCGFRVSR
ncbi:hypothetical protein ADK34_15505 [Streptomyces viridochromogenes]|uniref:Uncharacterized protein n=1 Tax=Streptomyces viridochromogenes TaxID=1938 RepID=A0A0L8KNY8_STRVR|nr:hypothetical protein ADK34_15505 [Streptomyces viridochromogenes]